MSYSPGTPLLFANSVVRRGASSEVSLGSVACNGFESTGGIVASGGLISMSGNAASDIATSSGALTLTSAAAATWSTAAGALTLTGTGGLNLRTTATAVVINAGGTAVTVQAGATLATTGTGNINLPNNGSARFQIEGASVSANVTSANLGTLTAGTASNADALHTHSQVAALGVGTAALASGVVSTGPIVLPSYTVATLPSAATYASGWIYVSDESGGAVPAFSDGASWRRCTDRAVVS